MKKPRVMLDSGAWTAFRQKKEVKREKYAQFVTDNKDMFDTCINLDFVNNSEESYKNWMALRKMGVETMPVYHMLTGKEQYLRKYLEVTDHIALGGVAKLNSRQRFSGLDRIWKKYLLDENGMPKVKVHGLGLTQIEQMIRYPWYSVDSFTPVISAVWGSVLLPLIRDDNPYYLGTAIYRISDQGTHKAGMVGSFAQLAKYPRLYNRYLEMFEEEGFILGKIEHQKQNDRRGKKGEQDNRLQPIEGILTFDKADTSKKTLANHWEERMRWNLTVWNKLQRRTPLYPREYGGSVPEIDEVIKGTKTIMHMGVSTTTHLEIFNLVHPKLDILISYAYMSDGVYKAIKNYVG
jgi:hypothetical protein